MKNKRILDIMKSNSFVVPLYLMKYKKKIGLTTDEFIFLIYLSNFGDKFIFDAKNIGNDLCMEILEVLQMIELLEEKRLLRLEVIKNNFNVSEEYLNLELFYNKILELVMEEFNSSDDNTNIFKVIEKEFGRTISQIEYEIIDAWLEDGYSEDIIKEAVKEAVLNGISSLKYIDRILFNWHKNGIKTVNDVKKYQENYRNSLKKEKAVKQDIFEYNWLEDEEE